MRRAFLAVLVVVCALSTSIFGLDVNKSELESVANQRIQFLNYQGPPQKVETREQIKGIGRYLGDNLPGMTVERDYAGRYRVIHAVDPTAKQGLDADVFIIEKDAEVDQIDNVRLILSGFLEAAYGYSESDSTLLAYFTTIYNAVYRGNMAFFGGRYKTVVVKNLSPDNAGIATSYRDWPGKTRMVIPLGPTAAAGVLGSLSPTELVGPRVIDELRLRQDMGIDQRKAMVDLLERVIQQKQQELQQQPTTAQPGTSRPQTGTGSQQSTQQQQPQKQEQQQAQQTQPQTQQEQSSQPQNAQQQNSQKQTQKEIQQLQQAVREQRDQIARDQRLLLDQQPAQPAITASAQSLLPVTFLEVLSTPSPGSGSEGITVPYGRLVKVNPLTFEPVQVSPVKVVLGRHIVLVGPDQRPVVIAGNSGLPVSKPAPTPADGSASSSASSGPDPLSSDPTMGRLVRLDPKTLAVDKVGDAIIYPASILELHDKVLYAVVHDTGQWYLGRFDQDLNLVERSAVEVNPYTTITFDGGNVWVQTADNRVIPLLVQDLRVAR